MLGTWNGEWKAAASIFHQFSINFFLIFVFFPTPISYSRFVFFGVSPKARRGHYQKTRAARDENAGTLPKMARFVFFLIAPTVWRGHYQKTGTSSIFRNSEPRYFYFSAPFLCHSLSRLHPNGPRLAPSMAFSNFRMPLAHWIGTIMCKNEELLTSNIFWGYH